MSYERLTKKRNDGTYYIKKCDETYCDGHCSCCDFGFDEEIRERLGELEDKIEKLIKEKGKNNRERTE